jgi:FkbM family methyltransferase
MCDFAQAFHPTGHAPRELMMILSTLRKPVDTFAPAVGRLYRVLRDATNRDRSIQTTSGFSLAGDPSMSKGAWEVGEMEAFLELMGTHDAVLDIGANVGFYSCLAASRGKHTIAFEPSSRNLKFLYRNLWENRFLNVEVFPLGLGGRCGLERIYGYGGIASFVPGWGQARKAQSSLVPLTTLDVIALGRFQNKKLLIKMDVEGFELEVLSGASGTLKLTPKPTWLVEIMLSDPLIPGGVSGKFADTFEAFWKHGYQCRKLNPARTPVGRADIDRWVANRFVDSGTHDFLFSAN